MKEHRKPAKQFDEDRGRQVDSCGKRQGRWRRRTKTGKTAATELQCGRGLGFRCHSFTLF